MYRVKWIGNYEIMISKESGRKRSQYNSSYYDGRDKPNNGKREASDISGTRRGDTWEDEMK